MAEGTIGRRRGVAGRLLLLGDGRGGVRGAPAVEAKVGQHGCVSETGGRGGGCKVFIAGCGLPRRRRVSRAGGRLAGRREGALAVHLAEAKRWHLRVEKRGMGASCLSGGGVGHVTMVGRGTAAAASGLARIARREYEFRGVSIDRRDGGGERRPLSRI